jgi:hypothetical protein
MAREVANDRGWCDGDKLRAPGRGLAARLCPEKFNATGRHLGDFLRAFSHLALLHVADRIIIHQRVLLEI